MSSRIETRPANEGDIPFLYELHRASLGEYVAQTWGWDEEWQAHRFREWTNLASRKVILCAGVPIGCIATQEHVDHIFLEYMAITPEYQRRGIGTRLLSSVLELATSRGVPVRLHVLRVNPARLLYERMGFRVNGGDENRLYLEKPPPDPGPSDIDP